MEHWTLDSGSLMLALDLRPWMATAGMLLLIAILLRRWSRYLRRQQQRAGSVRDVGHLGSSTPSADLTGKSDVDQWEVRMHETSRELSARLDNKMAALRHLIHTARQEQARLEATIREAEAVNSRR